MSDNNVEVRFGAVTDGSVAKASKDTQASVQAVSDAVSNAADTAKSSGKELVTLGSSLSEVRAVSADGAKALQQVNQSMGAVQHATVGARRELIVLAHEAITGNFSRMPGSFMVLAEQSKTLHSLFGTMFTALSNPPIAALTALAAVVGVVAIRSAEAAAYMRDLRVTMEGTGNAYLFDPKEIEQSVEHLKEYGYSAKEAHAAVAELHGIVSLHNGDLERANRLLPDLAASLHSVEAAAKLEATAFSDPARALEMLREQMERNDPDTLRTIEHMLQVGDTAGATSQELGYLEKATKDLADEGMGFLAKAMQGVIAMLEGQLPNAIHKATDAIREFNDAESVMVSLPFMDRFKASMGGGGDLYQQAKAVSDISKELQAGTSQEGTYVSRAAIDALKDLNVQLAHGDQLTRQLKVDSSELSQWQDKLAQAQRALSAANALGDTGRAAEQTQNVAAIEEKIAAVKRRAADEGLRSQLQTIDQEMDAYQTGSAERVRIAQQEVDLVRRTEGEKGALYRETTNKLRAEQRAATEAQRQARLSDLDGAQQVAQQDYAIQEQSIQLKRQLGQISATQEMQDLQKLKQQEYLVELQALQQKERLWQQGSKEYQKIQSQILVLQRKHEMEMRQIEAQSITQQQQKWTGFFSGLKSSFNSSVMGMIQGTQTFGQAVGNIFLGLGQAVFGVFEDMAAKWLVSQIVGTQAAATSARTEIGANAAVAGSAAFASTAAIPIIGPELAPAAASAAYASTMAFQAAVPGFAVGAWDLPSDTLAMVHQGETIMPKTFAEGFRENGGFGSSSGDVHVHLQAWDGPSVGRWIKNNKHTLAAAVASAHRDGNRSLGR